MSVKRNAAISILVAFVLIASFLAALLPQTISPHPIYATTTTVYFTYNASNSSCPINSSNGQWTVPTGVTSVIVLVVAGGGGGGSSTISYYVAGGGGAGGLIYNPSYAVTAGQNITVVVGDGGDGGSSGSVGETGENSRFGTIIAHGGGGGGGSSHIDGDTGGSGGGGMGRTILAAGNGVAGTSGEGQSGGNGKSRTLGGENAGGGGGGNTSAGIAGNTKDGGEGGTGGNYSGTFGTGVGASGWFAGGGGGGVSDGSGSTIGYGGTGGGGNGGKYGSIDATGGTDGTGGGGGGAGKTSTGGGNGGYGIVIVKYTTYTLTYTAGSHGSISGTSPQTVAPGASGSAVTANPDACYHFVNWSDSSTQNPRTDTNVQADISVTANFDVDVKTVTYSAGSGGTVNGSWPQNVNCGSDGPWVLASPDPSYAFVNWNDSSTTNPRHETNVTSNLSYTANFAISNSAPTITSVTLQLSDKATSTSSMTPQTAYNVEIVAGDADTINDINQIDIWIFRDDNAGDDGAPAGAWDADHEAIYRWAKSGSTWSMQNSSATTTWSITTGSCDTPGNMAATSGEWNLYFTVGKLAQESDGSAAEWDVKVTVTDSVAQTVSSTIYSKSMGSYVALSLSSATIDFGSIALGGTAAIQTPVAHYVTLISIANDTFALGSKSSTPWTNGASNANLDVDGSPAATYFSLTQDNAGDGSGHPTTPQYVTTSTVTITDLGSISRTSTAAGASESTTDTNIYMDCILGASGLKVVTYSGTITFTITNN